MNPENKAKSILKTLAKRGIGYGKALLFPILLYALFAIIALCVPNNTFFTAYTTEKIFQEAVLSTVVGLAIAVPLSGGRWDFATGTIPVLGGIVGLNLSLMVSKNVFVALIFCVLVCVLLAVLEGVIYISFRVPTMIVSLGVVMLYEALTNLLFDGAGINIYSQEAGAIKNLISLYTAPWCYVLLALVLIVTTFILDWTRFGADTKSLGSNSRLAVNAGVKEKKNILLTYVFIGVLLGIAALLNASKGKVEAANNLSSTALMFSSMGPVLVGLFLARYSSLPWGIFAGAIGFNVISYGLNAFGIDSSIQNIITGVVIVAIMAFTTNKEAIDRFLEKSLGTFKRGERHGC